MALNQKHWSHGCQVVRQEHTFVAGCHVSSFRSSAGDLANVLSADEIQGRAAEQQPADDIVIEALVRQPFHRGFRRASKRSRSPIGAHSGWEESKPSSSRTRFSKYFIRVLQVISDDLIDVRQLQNIIVLHDLLGRCPPIERSHHEIERDTSTADANVPCASRANGIASTTAVTSRLSLRVRGRNKAQVQFRGGKAAAKVLGLLRTYRT